MKTSTLYKHPGESRVYAFDFSEQPELIAGQTLTGAPTVASTLVSGAGSLTVGTASISGNKVQFQVSGGTIDAEWKLIASVTTSGGATIMAKGTLKIAEV